MTSQSLFKSQEFPELGATITMTKEIQTQPNVSALPRVSLPRVSLPRVSLPQTMPESPIQSFVIQPANPKAGCYFSHPSPKS